MAEQDGIRSIADARKAGGDGDAEFDSELWSRLSHAGDAASMPAPASAPAGTERHASGSRNACSMRCVVNVSVRTWAAPASAASTSTCALAAASSAARTASPGRSSVLDGMHAQ